MNFFMKSQLKLFYHSLMNLIYCISVTFLKKFLKKLKYELNILFPEQKY